MEEEAIEAASSSPAVGCGRGSPGPAAAALPPPPPPPTKSLFRSIAAARDRTLSLLAALAAASSGLGGSLRVFLSHADHSGGIDAASNFCGDEPEGVRTALRSLERAAVPDASSPAAAVAAAASETASAA